MPNLQQQIKCHRLHEQLEQVENTCQTIELSQNSSNPQEKFMHQPRQHHQTKTMKPNIFPLRYLIKLLILNSLLGSLKLTSNKQSQHHHHTYQHHSQPPLQDHKLSSQNYHPSSKLYSLTTSYPAMFPSLLLAVQGSSECIADADCDYSGREKICHENKCICPRDRPIEDQGRCLTESTIDDECLVDNQCLGGSLCIAGVCSCGPDAVSLWNPSAKLFYCHPKRQLNEKCNHDYQCPSNAYCFAGGAGCLCHNGYAPTSVKNMETGKEAAECLPKVCNPPGNFCESEFHHCSENLCKCLATHFDPHTARCYKLGSKGGFDQSKLLTDDSLLYGRANESAADSTKHLRGSNPIYSVFNDLIGNGDTFWIFMWIVISILILILVLILLFCTKRRSLGCGFWTKRKHQEWDPNDKSNDSDRRNFLKDKNSINNKSFRKRSKEDDIEEGNQDRIEGSDSPNLMNNQDDALEKESKHIKVDFLSATKAPSNDYQPLDFPSKGTSAKKVTDDNGSLKGIISNGVPFKHENTHLPNHSIFGPIISKTSTPV